MTAFETTRRDLELIVGLVMVPVEWKKISPGDNVVWREGLTWHVVSIEKHFATAMVRLRHAKRDGTIEVPLDEPVHVLEYSTGDRYAEHQGVDAVRYRKPKGKK